MIFALTVSAPRGPTLRCAVSSTRTVEAQPFPSNYRSSWNYVKYLCAVVAEMLTGVQYTQVGLWYGLDFLVFLKSIFSLSLSLFHGCLLGCHLCCLNRRFLSMDFFPRTSKGFPRALLIPIPPSRHPFAPAHLKLVQVCPSANRPYSGLLSIFSSLQGHGPPWRAGCKIRECLAACEC